MTQAGPLFLFELAGGLYALAIGNVREALHRPLLSRPPTVPPLLAGFLNLGGRIVPVLDLGSLFGSSGSKPGPYAHVLLVTTGQGELGLLVDRAEGAAQAPPEAFMSVGEGRSLNGCVEAEVRVGSRTAHLLSVERLLLEEERARLAELQAMERERLEALKESAG